MPGSRKGTSAGGYAEPGVYRGIAGGGWPCTARVFQVPPLARPRLEAQALLRRLRPRDVLRLGVGAFGEAEDDLKVEQTLEKRNLLNSF